MVETRSISNMPDDDISGEVYIKSVKIVGLYTLDHLNYCYYSSIYWHRRSFVTAPLFNVCYLIIEETCVVSSIPSHALRL